MLAGSAMLILDVAGFGAGRDDVVPRAEFGDDRAPEHAAGAHHQYP